MSDNSMIEWTDATWPVVTGCTRIGQGCRNCYAERNWHRLGANPKTVYHGRGFTDVACHPDRLDRPLRWRRPRMIFVPSMGDLFHEAVPDHFLEAVFGVMAAARQHTFQILTKRPDRMKAFMLHADRCGIGHWTEALVESGLESAAERITDAEWPPANIWLGVSAENQRTADERIPLLLETVAAVRFLSAEPLLEAVDPTSLDRDDLVFLNALTGDHRMLHDGGMTIPGKLPGLDWVIVGGESGPGARPMHPDWVWPIRDQCCDAEVPFFFKQWGEWVDSRQAPDAALSGMKLPRCKRLADGTHVWLVGKRVAGRLLDGRTWDEMPNRR